jgi:hypothetical protein
MPHWIDTRRAAELSGYTSAHIRDLVTSKRITARKFGIVWQVSESSLHEYLRNAAMLGQKRGRKRKHVTP